MPNETAASVRRAHQRIDDLQAKHNERYLGLRLSINHLWVVFIITTILTANETSLGWHLVKLLISIGG